MWPAWSSSRPQLTLRSTVSRSLPTTARSHDLSINKVRKLRHPSRSVHCAVHLTSPAPVDFDDARAVAYSHWECMPPVRLANMSQSGSHSNAFARRKEQGQFTLSFVQSLDCLRSLYLAFIRKLYRKGLHSGPRWMNAQCLSLIKGKWHIWFVLSCKRANENMTDFSESDYSVGLFFMDCWQLASG